MLKLDRTSKERDSDADASVRSLLRASPSSPLNLYTLFEISLEDTVADRELYITQV